MVHRETAVKRRNSWQSQRKLREMAMTEDEAKTMMERHGITAIHRTVYHYQGYNYGSLADALNYAEVVTSRADKFAARKRGEDKRSDRR